MLRRMHFAFQERENLMENKIIKLAIIALLGSTYTFAHAQNTKVFAEYGSINSITPAKNDSIIDEILNEGTDLTRFRNNYCQQQQQQQQQMGQYYEVCTLKVMIYRQRLFVKNGVLAFNSKNQGISFELNSDVSQNVLLLDHALPLYIQCESDLIERHYVINTNYNNYNYLNKIKYNKCIQNGIDQATCESISTEVRQQQQAQQIQQQEPQNQQRYNGWKIQGGSCKIVMEN